MLPGRWSYTEGDMGLSCQGRGPTRKGTVLLQGSAQVQLGLEVRVWSWGAEQRLLALQGYVLVRVQERQPGVGGPVPQQAVVLSVLLVIVAGLGMCPRLKEWPHVPHHAPCPLVVREELAQGIVPVVDIEARYA